MAERLGEQRDSTGVIASLWIHPIKSCAAVSVAVAEADSRGLVGDRRWMWVDEDGQFLSQRTHPELARIRAEVRGESLRLAADGAPDLWVHPPGPEVPLRTLAIWGHDCQGADAGDQPAAWLYRVLGVRARLMAHRGRRAVDLRYAADHEVGFADGFPLLVVSESAVVRIAERSGRSPDARRFRPNLVVGGVPAFAEDAWRGIRIGAVEIALVKPCGRCGVLDVAPDTGLRDSGLLASLRPDRHREGELLFGVNAVVVKPGILRVGDRVEVLQRR